tara:strand:+ start:2285 stop:3145 length:861 start_codon:yes stop_codon:yes gene_type:complete
MTIYINPRGRFGNVLFNIALLVILKEKYPQHKIFFNISILKHYYPNDYRRLLNLFPFIHEHITESNSVCNKIYKGHILEYNNIKDRDNVLYNGFFQRIEYYDKYRDLLKEKLLINLQSSDVFDGIIVHLRCGDCWGSNGIAGGTTFNMQPIPPISFYTKILNNETNIKFVVEQKDDPILLKLLDIYKDSSKNIIVQSEDIITDFKTLINSEKIILSISSFSWWAIFLSNVKIIHIPGGGFFNKNTPRKDTNWLFPWKEVIYHPLNCDIYLNKWEGNKNNLEYILNN